MNARMLKRVVGIAAASALVAVSVGIATTASASSVISQKDRITSQSVEAHELLEGILFATGPAASKIGIVAEETGVALPEDYAQLATETVAGYLQENASDADAALRRITSGNVLQVEKGLDALIKDYGSWLQAEAAVDQLDRQASASPQAAVCVWNVCVGNFVLGINVAVVAFAAVWVWVVNDAAQSSATVTKQQFVVRLTDAAAQ